MRLAFTLCFLVNFTYAKTLYFFLIKHFLILPILYEGKTLINYKDFRCVVYIFEFTGLNVLHGENFIAIFTTLSVVIWVSTGTLEIFATLVYVFTMRVDRKSVV